jgi:hypothetical protein
MTCINAEPDIFLYWFLFSIAIGYWIGIYTAHDENNRR